ncbi:hypothetical protein QV08_09220 [Gallibacterium salpingitidis]|uniref:DUF1640 domain-containing protein n=4 Tax=Pasteurellaceae TaxID=712 RepID=A0AB36E025_9PAST|nr:MULTISPECIES: hypothetical protein [Gallibacterium]OBW95817.1 hypothetical protein QV02_04805 [Gallibacterium anatis]OBW98264.1 hypothetical protein QV03_07720 [Gallibacterium anatis]OBX04297.1 hypothetical protein QV07_10255 [Gallibacterium genomosp. 3]OBX06781.1 hypothetical protein QV08_09220 [Gallibacterium salpingitidis]OBX07501.1 hypothetical protein QV09_10910 [Gallibacterium salpingitidis]
METSMSSIRFDKLRFVKKLQNANQSPEVAEAFAEALDEALEQTTSPLATKQDMLMVKQDLLITKQELKSEIHQLETRLVDSMHAAIYKMAGIIIAGIGILMTIIKFIH